MNEPTITLDYHSIENCMTKAGGFTNATLKALGVFPAKTGWRRRLEGVTMPESQYLLAYRGRLIMAKCKTQFIPSQQRQSRKKKNKLKNNLTNVNNALRYL